MEGAISLLMSTVLTIALLIALALVAGVLVMGVGSMARGGEFNRKYSNKLMRWRVILQAAAVLIILLIWFVR